MKRYVLFAVGSVAALWLGAVLTGSRADAAGNMLVKGTWPFGIPAPSPSALMAAGAGVLAAYLTK
jgi:hypothetical protein